MAEKRQSKSDYRARKAQNKGVAHGTTRMGKGGKALRTWNANTARWEKTSPYGNRGTYSPPKTSNGAAKTSNVTGTFTQSYARTSKSISQASIPDRLSILNQSNRERRRAVRASRIKSRPRLAKHRKSYGLTAKYSPKGLR